MRVGRRTFHFLILILTVAAVIWGARTYQLSRPQPPALIKFSGQTGGCGDFMVYRYSEDGRAALVVRVRDSSMNLPDGNSRLELAKVPTGDLTIELLQFRRGLKPGEEYFCSDVLPTLASLGPIHRWKAKSAVIDVLKNSAPGNVPAGFSNATQNVSVVLEEAVLELEDTNRLAAIKNIRIDDVWVGWHAG